MSVFFARSSLICSQILCRSGPIYPPPIIDETMFSCEEAMSIAYQRANLSHRDIDFFGLYDCFPVCLLRSLEACGLAPRGGGGAFVQEVYEDFLRTGQIDAKRFPVNTHGEETRIRACFLEQVFLCLHRTEKEKNAGGLLSFGAPWEVPAFFNILEAYKQLTHSAGVRQIPNASKALVYGNGGIFSASAVAILSRQ